MHTHRATEPGSLKTYHLSPDEKKRLEEFLREYPDELPLWAALYGLTPSQVGKAIARENVRRHGDAAGTIEEVERALKSCRSWRGLLANISRYGETPAGDTVSGFWDAAQSAVYALPWRKNSYLDKREETRELPPPKMRFAEHSPFLGNMRLGPAHAGTDETHRIPIGAWNYAQCRLCWRKVPVHPRDVSRLAPLCGVHNRLEGGLTAKEVLERRTAYRKHARHRKEAAALIRELTAQILPAYKRHNTDAEAWPFIRNLMTAPDSPFCELAAHLHTDSFCRVQDISTPAGLLTAFYGPFAPEAEEAMHWYIEDSLRYVLPLPLKDCIAAEAWLRAIKDRRKERKRG